LAETIAGIKIPNLKVRGMPKYPNFLNNREATLSTPHRLQTYSFVLHRISTSQGRHIQPKLTPANLCNLPPHPCDRTAVGHGLVPRLLTMCIFPPTCTQALIDPQVPIFNLNPHPTHPSTNPNIFEHLFYRGCRPYTQLFKTLLEDLVDD
jgi:hypothetical protein